MELVSFNSNYLQSLTKKHLPSVFFFSVLLLGSSISPFILNFMQNFSSYIGKNYMFLLCNGILVFIAKNSGLIGNSHQDISLLKKKTEEDVVLQVKEDQETEQNSLILEKTGKDSPLISKDTENERIPTAVAAAAEEEEEEEEEEVIGLLSAEELNKKCEDFIRMMKAGIKFEAQQY